MKKYKLFIFLILFVSSLTGFVLNDDQYFKIAKNLDLFGKIFKEISNNYVEEVDAEELLKAGINGMLGALDPYTVYIDDGRKGDIDLITYGKYGGIGISIGVRGNRVTITDVFEGYSAQRQGIKAGDILYKVSNKEINAENVDEVSRLVKGAPGSEFELKILRNEDKDTISFNLVREEIQVKNISYAGFFPENSNNVYIKLNGFSKTAANELKVSLKDLQTKKNIESIILDLRNNPGGLLDVAIEVCEKFLPQNSLVVSTKGKNDEEMKKFYSVSKPLFEKTELIVLVNENSASASEIVAGAIQDHDRGLIVGEKTYGKGLVQTITGLGYNASLKITTSRYYTPSGRCIQKVDYSEKNKVVVNKNAFENKDYLTDNKRIVYSAGGITPDTIISRGDENEYVEQLLAKGIFFNFANAFFNQNTKTNYNDLDDNKLFSEFSSYLNKSSFIYVSETEKHLDAVMNDLKKKKFNENYITELNKIKTQLEKSKKNDLNINKDNVVREIRSELALRYLGQKSKVEETLRYDNQFRTALKLLKDKKTFNLLLGSN